MVIGQVSGFQTQRVRIGLQNYRLLTGFGLKKSGSMSNATNNLEAYIDYIITRYAPVYLKNISEELTVPLERLINMSLNQAL